MTRPGFVREAYGYTERAKKKTVAKTDVDKAIDTADCLAFLEGAMDDWAE